MADTGHLPSERVAPFAYELMDVIRSNMCGQPPGNDNVFVALNAVAIAAASILCGTVGPKGEVPSPHALSFFNSALSTQCRELTGGEGAKLNG